MKLFVRITTLLALALCLVPSAVQAHGSVFTFKHIDGPTIIMVTHNVHDAQSGVPIQYNLRLYDLDGKLLHFQKVQAVVRQGDKILLDKTLTPSEFDDVTFDYTYPKQGDNYKLSTTFLDNDKQIAHGDFPIVVQRGLGDGFFDHFFSAQTAVAFIAGVVGMKLWADYRPRRKKK